MRRERELLSVFLIAGAMITMPASDSLAQTGRSSPAGARTPSAAVGLLPASPRDTLHLRRTTGTVVRMGYITALAIAGDELFVGDMKLSPHLARFDAGSLRLLGRYGDDGVGRGSLREPSCITPNPDDPTELWVFDRNRSVLADYRIARRTATVERETLLPNVPRSTVCAARAGGRILLQSYFPDYLAVTDSIGGARQSIDAPPPYAEHRDLNTAVFARSPSGRRLALAYNYSTRLDIFDAAGVLRATIHGPRPTNALQYAIVDRPGGGTRALVSERSQTAYLGLAATERFLYAIYSGCSAGPCVWSGTQVQVFRWDGTFVRDFAVDRPLLKIAVSADDAVLYAVYANDETGYDQHVGQWLLPQLRP